MTAASPHRRSAAALAVALTGLLAGCFGAPSTAGPATTRTSGSASVQPSAAEIPPYTATPRPPLPTASQRSSLPASPPAQLTPVSSSPKDLGRIDVRHGSPTHEGAPVRLPAASGYTVTAGCIGPPGTLLHWSVVSTTGANPGFLFGSTTPCNGAFVTDAAMANIQEPTAARLEVTLGAGVEAATVVLRPAPADSHL